jgi:hypothetical protein
MKRHEATIQALARTFPSGVRDFLLARQEGVDLEALQPLELLTLDRTNEVIKRVGSKQPALALNLSLCRLLVPCLKYRGSDRHLVVEPWSLADVSGAALPADVPTDFARELSSAQARQYRAVTTGEPPPAGSLAELFWASQTELPALADSFDDPELGRLAKALYFHLIREGSGSLVVDAETSASKVETCRADGFSTLGLGTSPRKLRETFRRLLAVTVRYASQLMGQVAAELVNAQLGKAGLRPLTAAERELLDLRYGACRALNDLNVGFLFGCGPVLAGLVNAYLLTIAAGASAEERQEAEERLRAFVYLLARYQERRKQARAQERRDDRQRHADRLPGGRRQQADYQEDRSEPPPEVNAAAHESMACLEMLLPTLKARDAERLQAFIDCAGDRKAAAEQLGLGHAAYSRQLRQTVFPALRTVARQKQFNPFA